MQIGEEIDRRIKEGILVCGNGHLYRITGFIPRLLADAALEGSKAQTQGSFSAKWNRLPDLGEAFTGFQKTWYLDDMVSIRKPVFGASSRTGGSSSMPGPAWEEMSDGMGSSLPMQWFSE